MTHAYVQHPYSYFSLSDPLRNIENGKILKLLPGKFTKSINKIFCTVLSFLAGSTYEVIVKFNSENQVIIGNYKIPVAFNFQDANNFTFTIARSIVSKLNCYKLVFRDFYLKREFS